MPQADWIAAEEAQARLKVRPQTLYAYVSRGRVSVRPDPHDPRRSLYRAADIAALTEGIKSGMEGSKPKFSEQELMTAMQAFENMMQAKAQEEQKARMANAGKVKEDGLKFLAENGKKKGVTTTKSGLQYEVLKEGDGPKPVATDRVNVHYHGTLISGKVFDSSVERGQPITFGVQEVIKGWTEALQLMPVGSKWRIYLPSDIAYGDQGAGEDIGPGETLIFDVELLGIVK